jgi:hypothetical protein
MRDSSPRRMMWPEKQRRPQSGTHNARQQYERYLARAREVQVVGDVVEVENCYQHAEHYFRVMCGELSYKTHILIARRLDRYSAGKRMQFTTSTPDMIAEAMVAAVRAPPRFKPGANQVNGRGNSQQVNAGRGRALAGLAVGAVPPRPLSAKVSATGWVREVSIVASLVASAFFTAAAKA